MDDKVAALFPLKLFVPSKYRLTRLMLIPLRCHVVGIQLQKLKVRQLSTKFAVAVACEAARGCASSRWHDD
eukprot:5441014-Pyramimonas_sp.AAC.1